MPESGSPTLDQVDGAIGPFVEAVNKNEPPEKQLSPEQVISGLTWAQLKNEIKVVDYQGTPLLLKPQGSTWIPATTKNVGNLLIKIGGSFDASDNGWNSSGYQQTILDNFQIDWIEGPLHPSTLANPQYGTTFADYYRNLAGNKSNLYIHAVYWYGDSTNPEDATKEKMQKRAALLMSYARKVDNGYQPTYIDVTNEVVAWYPGYLGLTQNDPFLNTYGRNAIAEEYMTLKEAADAKGLTVGKDVIFVVDSSAVLLQGETPMLDYSYQLFDDSMREIARRLNVQPEQVPLNFTIQGRLDKNNSSNMIFTNSGRLRVPTKQEVISGIRKLAGLPNKPEIYVNEANVVNATPAEIADIIDNILLAGSIEAGLPVDAAGNPVYDWTKYQQRVYSFTFEGPLDYRPNSNNLSGKYVDLFTAGGTANNTTFEKTANYYLLLRSLYQYLLKTSQ
jgi:hypothetical protein